MTAAANITNAIPGTPSVAIPVTVTGFTNVGQFVLTMTFDTTLVRVVSSATNPSLPGMNVSYVPPVTNTQGKLIFSWTGASNVSLTSGASLATLIFTYVKGTGMLSWAYTYGSVCQYKSYVGGTLTTMNDSPQYQFYKNGGISNRGAPATYAPVLNVTALGTLPVPITVNGFTGIAALTLNLEYDPAIMTYQGFVKNPAFNSAFQVGNIAGTGSKKLIVIQWYGNAVTLSDGSALCTLNFNYIAANSSGTTLNWFDNGPSCEYADASAAALIDLPKNDYYHDGMAAPPIASVSISPSASQVCGGTTVTFTAVAVNGGTTPVYQWKVNGTNAGSNSSTFSYIPLNNDAVTCVLTSSLPVVGGSPATSNQVVLTVASFPVSISVTASANPDCAGIPVTYTAAIHNGGTSPFYQWKVNGITAGTNSSTFVYVPANNDAIVCVVTSNAPCATGNPATSGQVSMTVYPEVFADFIADKLTPLKTDTVTLSDLSTGGASSWNWSFDRPEVVFLNGTNAGSRNPQVKFTDGGLYSITLVAASSCFSDTTIKTGYIRAGISGLWSGNTSSEWNILSNWDNFLAPGSTTDVTIPPSAPNWPVFDGDLILGIHCGSLTLSGTTSQLTITGNLIIP